MAGNVTVTVTGIGEIIRNLASFGSGVKNRALRNAMSKGNQVTLREMKSSLRNYRTGATRQSLGHEERVKGETVFGRVGSRKAFERMVGNKKHRPSRIVHLLEGGHQKGRGKSAARAFPFMAPAHKKMERQLPVIVTKALLEELERIRAR